MKNINRFKSQTFENRSSENRSAEPPPNEEAFRAAYDEALNEEKSKEGKRLSIFSLAKKLAERTSSKTESSAAFITALKKQLKEEEMIEGASPISQMAEGASATGGAPRGLSSISELTPQMEALFRELECHIVLMEQKGVQTTTLILNMSGSVLDGAEIQLEQYNTTPPSFFNVKFFGSEAAARYFSTNLTGLAVALENRFEEQGHEFRFYRPGLKKKEKAKRVNRGKES